MIKTNSLSEARYLLRRALRSRGMSPDHLYLYSNPDKFKVVHATGCFTLSFMPGNRRVLISSDSYVIERERGQGLGRKLLKMREEIAREAGVNLLLATVREDNAIEIHLLETSGWKRFNKRETGVCLWGKEL